MSHGIYHLEPDVNNLSQIAVVVMPAKSNLVGGVMPGAGTAIDVNGVLSLAPATAQAIGGVKIGANISVAADGTISVAAPGGGGAVASVFGRTGAVVAASGDYSAAQVTNAVDKTQSYPNPAWIASLPWSKITGAPSVSSYQTPWLQNIDAAGFTLSNVPSVSASAALTVAAAGANALTLQTNAKPRATVDSAGHVVINAPDDAPGGATVAFLKLTGSTVQRIVADASAVALFASAGNIIVAGTGNAQLQTGATPVNRLVIDSAGHVTISNPDNASTSAVYVAGGILETARDSGVTCNIYWNGANWIYRQNGAGIFLSADSTQAKIYAYPSGTAGASAPLILALSFPNANTVISNVPFTTLIVASGGAAEASMPNSSAQMYFISNTQLGFTMRGTDGVLRRGSITMA